MLALIDCNNFFVSCERLGRPELANVPVAVLSNNDGVVISRSNEVKAMGIPMGAPFFQYRHMMENAGVKVFSGSHTLYSDISRRVMKVLDDFSPKVEVYSIDEAFICLKGFEHKNLREYGKEIKQAVEQRIGIPVSVGIAPTKTLAKIATERAKKRLELGGVMVIESDATKEQILEETVIQDVWGIGRRTAEKMYLCGIGTAKELTRRPDAWIRKKFHVFGLRIANELRGLECSPVSDKFEPHQTIMVSSSFGKPIASIEQLYQAIATFTNKATEKLRRDRLRARNITIFLKNKGFFYAEKSYSESITIKLNYPTDNTAVLISQARILMRQLYQEGIAYRKCGVILTDLQPVSAEQGELFDQRPKTQKIKESIRSEIVDKLNNRFGRGTIFYAAQGLKQDWKPRSRVGSSEFAVRTDKKDVGKWTFGDADFPRF